MNSSPLRVSCAIASFLEPVLDKVRPSKEYYTPCISLSLHCFNWFIDLGKTVLSLIDFCSTWMCFQSLQSVLRGTADHSKSGCPKVFSIVHTGGYSMQKYEQSNVHKTRISRCYYLDPIRKVCLKWVSPWRAMTDSKQSRYSSLHASSLSDRGQEPTSITTVW